MTSFRFNLKDQVGLAESSEHGVVVGRAEYTNSANNYLIRYKAGDNRQVEAWWAEDAIRLIEAKPD